MQKGYVVSYIYRFYIYIGFETTLWDSVLRRPGGTHAERVRSLIILYSLFTLYTPSLPFLHLCTLVIHVYTTIFTPTYTPNTPKHPIYTLYTLYTLKQPITQVR